MMVFLKHTFYQYCLKFLLLIALFFSVNLKAQYQQPKEFGKVAYVFQDLLNKKVSVNDFIVQYYLDEIILPKKKGIQTYEYKTLLQKIHLFNYDYRKRKNIKITLNTFDFKFKKSSADDLSIILVKDSSQHVSFQKLHQVIIVNKYGDKLEISSQSKLVNPILGDSLLVKSHVLVWNEFENNTLKSTKYYNLLGDDLTNTIFEKPTEVNKHVLFFNGYRGENYDKDESKRLTYNYDRTNYWLGMDKKFIEILKPNFVSYQDGHASVKTSVHKSKLNFAISYLRIQSAKGKERKAEKFKMLNTKENKKGFQKRFDQGMDNYDSYLIKACIKSPVFVPKDTVIVFAHSMGAAYSQGFISRMDENVYLKTYFILSPEGAKSNNLKLKLFDYVWQYGSNLGYENSDPVWQQDGIAPQSRIPNLEKLAKIKSGHFFIPKDWPSKNFIDSHMLYNYDWILEIKGPGEIK